MDGRGGSRPTTLGRPDENRPAPVIRRKSPSDSRCRRRARPPAWRRIALRGFIFALSLLDTVVLLSLIFWLLMRRGERPRQVFFGNRPIVRETGAGVLSLPVVFAIIILVSVLVRQFAPWLHNVPDNPLERFSARSPAC